MRLRRHQAPLGTALREMRQAYAAGRDRGGRHPPEHEPPHRDIPSLLAITVSATFGHRRLATPARQCRISRMADIQSGRDRSQLQTDLPGLCRARLCDRRIVAALQRHIECDNPLIRFSWTSFSASAFVPNQDAFFLTLGGRVHDAAQSFLESPKTRLRP